MSRNLAEAREMATAARESALVACLYPPRPGLKGDLVMKRLLNEEGFVGDVTEVRVTGMALARGTEQYSWISDPEVTGVHAMTLGMWAEVLHRWVGPAARLMAVGKTHRHERRDPHGKPAPAVVPDSLAIVAELHSGATASYHFSDCASYGPGHAIEIYGMRGALVYQFFPDVLRGATEGSEQLEVIKISPAEERLHTTDVEFIRAIREGTPFSPGFEEGLRYMEFCEAVAASVYTQRPVVLPPAQPFMKHWFSPIQA
jgi:predicted dehydrogenase